MKRFLLMAAVVILTACGGGNPDTPATPQTTSFLAAEARMAQLAFTPATQDELYQFFAVAFGAAPGVTYMGQLNEAANAGMSTKQIVNIFTTKSQFTDVYPTTLSNTDFATKLVDNVVGSSATTQAKVSAANDVLSALGLTWTRGDVIFAIFTNLAGKPSTDPDWAGTSQKMKNQVIYARYYTEVMKGDTTDLPTLQKVVASVTESSNTSSGIEQLITAALNGIAPSQLVGTAAIGAPIAGSVFAIDINGKVSPAATTTALGTFIVDVAGMTPPYILSITGTVGGKQVNLNSIATASGQTVNITPLTDLIVSTAAGQPGGSSLTSLCAPVANVVPTACLSALTSASTPAKLASATQAVINMIAPLNLAGTNPLTGKFDANGTGMDAVLDQILMTPAGAQGAMATITLIATGTPLGTVTMPATAGQTATAIATTPSTTELTKATAAATVMPEIRACLASFNALYPKTNFVPPTSTRVAEFIDDSFRLGVSENKSAIVGFFSGTGDMAKPGLTLEALGMSPYDMNPLSAGEISTFTQSTSTTRIADLFNARIATGATAVTITAGVPSSAWVQLRVASDSGLNNWKFVKNTAYNGCPGGWKLAGSGHLDMHMNARISRSIDGAGAATFDRQWAFHIDKATVLAENPAINKIDVRGPGLTTYGDYTNAITTGQKLQLIMPTTGLTAMRFDDSTGIGAGSSYYGNSEALQSCQDLAGSSAGSATPCLDETKVAPGMVYVWTLKAAGVPVIAFPFQINAVPLSKAFAKANQSSLFATVISVTPSGSAALFAMKDTLLDGKVTYNYTQSATYGSKMDNCGLYLWNGSAAIMSAEQNAVGHETSCTFTTSGLNSVASNVSDTFQFTGALTSGYIGVTTSVLGNQASSSQPYPN